MTTLREAAQQALEALSFSCPAPDLISKHNAAESALRAALEQPEQEPVAWRSQNASPPGGFVIFQQYPQALADLGRKIEPLYTHPPRREWRGLTEEEMIDIQDRCGVTILRDEFLAIEAALKEKNHD